MRRSTTRSICVTVCPTGAIGLPRASLSQHEAEVVALLMVGGGAPAVALREPAATAAAILDLTRNGNEPSRSLVHPASPLGVVELREEERTVCGACAAVCPTGALAVEEDGDSAAIVFEPAACLPRLRAPCDRMSRG